MLSGDLSSEFLRFNMECSASNSKEDFYSRVYPALVNILPHSMFGGFVGTLYDNHLYLYLKAGFTKDSKALSRSPDPILTCPLFERWKKVMKPLVIDNCEESQKFLGEHFSAMEYKDIQTVACHGQTDINYTSFCYFIFLGVDNDSKSENYDSLLELVTPQLQSVFTRICSHNPKSQLSARELEVLSWIAKGHSNGEIADILRISIWTVQSHVKNVMRKMDVGKRSQAVAKGRSYGFIKMSS